MFFFCSGFFLGGVAHYPIESLNIYFPHKLRVMVMKRFFTPPRSSVADSHYETQFSIILSSPHFWRGLTTVQGIWSVYSKPHRSDSLGSWFFARVWTECKREIKFPIYLLIVTLQDYKLELTSPEAMVWEVSLFLFHSHDCCRVWITAA